VNARKEGWMMNKKSILILTFLMFTIATRPVISQATDHSGGAIFEIEKSRSDSSQIQDPEDSKVIVNPGESPGTEGDLRIDFVPYLNFSTVEMKDDISVLPVNAQLFHDSDQVRGNFIQVTDQREKPSGWTIQLRQETQFKQLMKQGAQLKGATISFDHTWTNSATNSQYSPEVSKEVIQMNHVGETYTIATAKAEQGMGTWSIIFGASKENTNKQRPTVFPRIDNTGNIIEDPVFKKPSYVNNAVNLTIPKTSENEAGTYSTVLTWIIAELP